MAPPAAARAASQAFGTGRRIGAPIPRIPPFVTRGSVLGTAGYRATVAEDVRDATVQLRALIRRARSMSMPAHRQASMSPMCSKRCARAMHQHRGGVRCTVDSAARLRLLSARPDWLRSRLDPLRKLQSREAIERWPVIGRAQWRELVAELLELHRPAYHRSQNQNFTGLGSPARFACDDSDARRR